MNAQVVVSAALAVLLHVSAARGFSVESQNSGHQLGAGDGFGMKQVSEEIDVSNRDLAAGNLVLVKEIVGNHLHDIRRREARSEKRSRKRLGDESGMDQKDEPDEKVLMKGILDSLEPQKEMIINFMKPILDRIKHRPKKSSLDSSSESPASPGPSTPAPSSTPSDSDASSSSDPDTSSSFDSSASNSSDSDASTLSNPSANIFPVIPSSFSKCGLNEGHRSISTLSLLFPDLQSNEGEQPFAFVPLTNTLMRVLEQQIIGESQSGGNPKSKRHN